MDLVENDISSNAFGIPWGHTRTYANVLSNNAVGVNGNSWLVRQLKALLFVGVAYGDNTPEQICIVNGANSSRWFILQDGAYVQQFSGNDTLTYDSDNFQFVWMDIFGNQTFFFDNSTHQPPQMAGKFKAAVDRFGRMVNATYDADGNLLSFVQEAEGQTSGYYYAYISETESADLLASVTLQVNGEPVRRAAYEYYASGARGGSIGDLMTCSIEQYRAGDASWLPVTQRYYRYYTADDSAGFVHGLKYVVRDVSYQRMVQSGLDPKIVPDDLLAEFANFYFEYDSEHRVTREDIRGGQQTYLFAYASNPASPGFSDVNTWSMQTIETLPDGNQNRVYTNAAGQLLLQILHVVSTGRQWYEYSQYDSHFHRVLKATSFAVDSVTEPVLPGSNDLVVNLKPSDGLIRGQVFYTTTDPTSGAVEGYLQKETVQQGADGAAITVRSLEYTSQSAFGNVIYPVRADVTYPNEDGTNTARRTYDYAWYPDIEGHPSFQVQQKAINDPGVSTSQNGSETPGVTKRYFNSYGWPIWFMNQRGAISYTAYEPATGAVLQEIKDVDTSLMQNVPDGWETQSDWGLHLITDYVNDALGRPLQARGPWHDVQLRDCDVAPTPIRGVEFTAYLDAEHERRKAKGYMTGDDPVADFHTVGPVSITQSNAGGRVENQIQAVRCCNSGPLTAGERFPQEKWSRWSRYSYDTWNRLTSVRLYFRIPFQGEGDAGANYLESLSSYDEMGRLIRVVDPSGTIQRVVYEERGFVVSTWTGTNDFSATPADPTGGGAGGNNMVMISASQYDNGVAGGDGNLTQVTLPVDASSANDRVTTLAYDYRDRQISITQTDGATNWITVTTYDNLDRLLQNSTYKSSVATANLIAQARTFYDSLGRIYRLELDGVNTSSGTIVNTLSSQNWFDLAGNRIKANRTGSTSFTKTTYDALNRPTGAYLACVPGTAGVPTGDDNNVSTDTVLEQVETMYDPAGNVVFTTVRKRFDDATGVGVLKDVQTEPKARVTFAGFWPDAIDRQRVSADFGTNGGAALARPGAAPSRSDTVLVTTIRYKQDGDENAIVDPAGLETRWENDQAGRRIRLVENFVECCPEKSRISEYAWHPSGQLQRLTLVNSETGNQTTTWAYGTTLNDSALASNNLVRSKTYPESEDRPAPVGTGPNAAYAQLLYSFNRQGQASVFIDADGTVHDYDYDKLGRLVADAVPTLGTGLDNGILRIERAYEVRGMLQTVTSYDAASGGTVVNQVAFTYDAFSNLTYDKQSHSGPVTGTTPFVAYDYENGSNNTVRRIEMDYPNGNFMAYYYGEANSIDDHLSRISGIALGDDSTNIVDYRYIGAAWQSLVSYTEAGVELTYKMQGSEPVGDAGDPYTGYDRFGRTVDMRWQTISSGASLERIQYGFDRDSRRTWRRRVLATGLDNAYFYDGLSQVTNAAVGNLNLNATAIGGIPAQNESWEYDPTGNWEAYQTQANGGVTLDQTRVHDKGNRLTQISNDPQPVLLDQAGRMLQVAPDASGDWTQSMAIRWDAWSRIMEIRSGDTVLGSYTYDGLTRRLTVTAGDVPRHTYYSDAWRPLEERIDATTTASAQFYWGVRHRDDLVRRDRATGTGGPLNETRYVLMDYFSPTAITNDSGTVTERYEFSAFGIRSILAPDFSPLSTSECAWTFAFHGQFVDIESGLFDYGFRYYSPQLGSWLSKDPIEEEGGLNLYQYASGNPVNSTDLLGLDEVMMMAMKTIAMEETFGGGPADPIADVLALVTLIGFGIADICLMANHGERNWQGKNPGRPKRREPQTGKKMPPKKPVPSPKPEPDVIPKGKKSQ